MAQSDEKDFARQAHPNLCEVLELIRREQAVTEVNIQRLEQHLLDVLGLDILPYSSKFSRHKNFVKHSKFAKFLIFVLKIS